MNVVRGKEKAVRNDHRHGAEHVEVASYIALETAAKRHQAMTAFVPAHLLRGRRGDDPTSCTRAAVDAR